MAVSLAVADGLAGSVAPALSDAVADGLSPAVAEDDAEGLGAGAPDSSVADGLGVPTPSDGLAEGLGVLLDDPDPPPSPGSDDLVESLLPPV